MLDAMANKVVDMHQHYRESSLREANDLALEPLCVPKGPNPSQGQGGSSGGYAASYGVQFKQLARKFTLVYWRR